MKFQIGDHVLYDGMPCRVKYSNAEVVVIQRDCDAHLMMWTPEQLAAEQTPWIQRSGWWSQMRDVQQGGRSR